MAPETSAGRTPRILHVARPLDGGIPRIVARLAADQVSRGWDVVVACPPESELTERARDAGATVVPWPASRAPGPSTPGETRRLARIIRDRDPHLVHLHAAKAGLAGRLALRGRRPTLFQPQDWSFNLSQGAISRASRGWEAFAVRWTDVVVCVSDGEQRLGEAAGVRGRYEIVPNGIDAEHYAFSDASDRALAREELGIAPDAKLVVLGGRLCRQKGQDLLLAVWPDVLARVPDAQLVLVGDGEDREALEAAAGPGVRFAGAVADMRDWLRAASVVTMPSRSEGASILLLEAMATGRSVVATDVAGMREALGADAGAVAGPTVDAAFVDALSARLENPGLAADEGLNARRVVTDSFSLDATHDTMAQLYAQVLSRSGQPPLCESAPSG